MLMKHNNKHYLMQWMECDKLSAFNYKELKRHVGHDIVCVSYGNEDNVAIECETCNEVLLDYDKEEDE